jgi:tetratricopeptide (TPR) repeat protein
MRVANRAWKINLIVLGSLLLMLQMGLAQKKSAAGTPNDPRKVLVEKARALELRGRPDMAIQLWQQVLLSDPGNTEALAGLAKDYKLTGSSAQADEVLQRLRRINPNDPNIAKIEGLSSTKAQSDRLRQAGDLAKQGKAEEAMRIYREQYGDHPPDGDIALAYYQTLYGTASGKDAAIAGMRALAQRNPGDARVAIELGVMLTYAAKTRSEGIRILQAHAKDAGAQSALRQALVWEAANPASAAELRQYLKDHPQDTELAARLKENEAKLAQMNAGIARTPAERAAFAALNEHKLQEAQTRFTEILEQEPENGRAAAGLGFLRMQQNNFGGAISYLTQAEQNGFKDQTVEEALVTSRFWYTMAEAAQAADEKQFDVAAIKYHAALNLRPHSPEALNGLAGLLLKEQKYSAAVGVYEQLLVVQAGSTDAWRGLFLAYARDGQNQKALAVEARCPATVKAALAKDPEYLRSLAALYNAENRPEDARRVLAVALALPFPDNGVHLKVDTRMEYAGILMEAKRFGQAAALYIQILNGDASNLSAWMGLVSAHHQLGQDKQAIADVEKMAPATYEAALADPDFLLMLGAIYQQDNQLEIAQGLLERAAKQQTATAGEPSIPVQLQLAAIDLARNNDAQAYEIYRKVLVAHPDRLEAWKGLISSMQASGHVAEAMQEIVMIPPSVRRQLEADVEFIQSEASLYAASGDTQRAVEYMNRVEAHYSALKSQMPANVAIQNAWLLYNTKNDRGLYPALMRLGSRGDLTVAQRETVQMIWANWSVRRAVTAYDNGNVRRAVEILTAAMQAFADNIAVRKVLAGGYLRVGQAKQALAIYKTVSVQEGSAADFQGAVGAALAANDKTLAEAWLRQALERFPKNAAILTLAARFEQARGNNQRAADYLRASLAAMPQPTPASRLAHELAYPEPDEKAHRAGTPAELARLLNPEDAPFATTAKLPPLPAYGPDPYNGTAPVVLPQTEAVLQPQTWDNAPQSAPSSAAIPVPAAANPVVRLSEAPSDANRETPAQNAPTVQEAASASFALQPQAQPQIAAAEAPQPTAPVAAPEKRHKKGKTAERAAIAPPSQPAPTLATAPGAQNPPPPAPELPLPPAAMPTATTADSGLTDQQLQQSALPPLRGAWVRVQREPRTPNPRDEAEEQLSGIESGYSPWLGGTGIINYRSGDLGFDHLTALEAPFEASMPLGYNARLTVAAKPVFLDSGQADGTSVVQLSTLGQKNLGAVPQPIGTLLTTDTAPPSQQNAAGVGGEVQLAFQNLALAAGYTPSGFLVANITGRAQWKPDNGPITLSFVRDSVKDTQLSYAGLRDPGSASLLYPGNIWGGVIATQGSVQFARGDAESGYYFGAGGQSLTGHHVQSNTRIDGSGGAYWRLLNLPEYGNLTIGTSFFGMHYAHNERAFTYGMGGYFSPQAYFLANVPFTWNGHSGTRWHYNLLGSLGVQAFQEDLSALFPLDKSLEVNSGILVGTNTYSNLAIPAKTSVGPNYDLRTQAAYSISPHWFAGGFLSGNNSRNYSSVSAGFFVRYLFRAQPAIVDRPTGIFPTDGLRPFMVP